jgi:segregation and condensation protein B
MKKQAKKGDKKAKNPNSGNEVTSYVSEYAHILEAELAVNPDFGHDPESDAPPLAVFAEDEWPANINSSPVDNPAGIGNSPAQSQTPALGDTPSGLGHAPDIQVVFEGVLDMAHQIEALLFASERPLDVRQVTALLSSMLPEAVKINQVQRVLDELLEEWQRRPGGFELVQSGGGYCFLTRSAFLPIVQKAVLEQSKRKLSVASLETLSIVAYKQPVSKSEVEQIRGVNCDFSVQKLLEKNLIRISGKGDGPGRPTLYSTTDLFMDYFGINSIKQLPHLKDFEQDGYEIGRDDDDGQSLNEMLHVSSGSDMDFDPDAVPVSSGDSEGSDTTLEGQIVQDANTEIHIPIDSRDAANPLS